MEEGTNTWTYETNMCVVHAIQTIIYIRSLK